MSTLSERIDDSTDAVRSAKALLADAITSKGVDTSSSDTFSTMRENILNIPQYRYELAEDQIEFLFVGYFNSTLSDHNVSDEDLHMGGDFYPEPKVIWFNSDTNSYEFDSSIHDFTKTGDSLFMHGDFDTEYSLKLDSYLPDGLLVNVLYGHNYWCTTSGSSSGIIPDMTSTRTLKGSSVSVISGYDYNSNMWTYNRMLYAGVRIRAQIQSLSLDDGAKIMTTNEYGILTTRFIKEPTLIASIEDTTEIE